MKPAAVAWKEAMGEKMRKLTEEEERISPAARYPTTATW